MIVLTGSCLDTMAYNKMCMFMNMLQNVQLHTRHGSALGTQCTLSSYKIDDNVRVDFDAEVQSWVDEGILQAAPLSQLVITRIATSRMI